jgi:hypothetical protein
MWLRRLRPGSIAVVAGALLALGLTACSDDSSDGDPSPSASGSASVDPAALRADCETVQKVLTEVADEFPYGPQFEVGKPPTQADISALIALREGFQRNRFHVPLIQDRLVESIAAISRITTDPSKRLSQRVIDKFNEAGANLGAACTGAV